MKSRVGQFFVNNSALAQRQLAYFFSFWILLFALRMYSWVEEPKEIFGEINLFGYAFRGIFLDGILASIVFIGTCVIDFLLSLFKLKFSQIPTFLIHLVFLIAFYSLNQYFIRTEQVLTDAIYLLSWNDVKTTIGSSENFSITMIVALLLAIVSYLLIGKGFKQLLQKNRLVHSNFYLILPLIGLCCSSKMIIQSDNIVENMVMNNRLSVFLDASYQFFSTKDQQDKHLYKTTDFEGISDNFFALKPTDKNYPLFHQLPDESDLAAYFKTSERPPNITYIIIESMNSSFIGERAHETGNVMPFLDELAKKSLYFPNILSTCERTHNVLPASLASVPNAPSKNMMQQMQFPAHFALPALLKKYYFSSFFCGVDMNFVNMSGYMNHIQTDYVAKDWGTNYSKKINGEDYVWGYPDQELFRKYLEEKEKSSSKKSRLDVLLTISTHDPYLIPEKAKEEKLFDQHIKKYVTNDSKKDFYKTYKSILVSYFYTDRQIKLLFEQLQKQPDFQNTIFFIFGDHGTNNFAKDQLDRFHVPLIVYSPLLKKPAVFPAVSTHLDIAPSLYNFLIKQYKLVLPTQVPFMGKELDFTKKYQNNRTLALNATCLENLYLVDKNYYLDDQVVYKIAKNLKLKKCKQAPKTSLTKQLKLYNQLVNYLYFRNRFLPDSYYATYINSFVYKGIHQELVTEIKGEKGTDEFVDLGDFIKLPINIQAVKIEVNAKAKFTTDQNLIDFPKLTVSIDNLGKEKNTQIAWKNINCNLQEAFKKNKYCAVQYTMELSLKDLPKLSKLNEFKYYIYNPTHIPIDFKNVQTKISIALK